MNSYTSTHTHARMHARGDRVEEGDREGEGEEGERKGEKEGRTWSRRKGLALASRRRRTVLTWRCETALNRGVPFCVKNACGKERKRDRVMKR